MTPAQWLLVGMGALFVALLFTLRRVRKARGAPPPPRVSVSVTQRKPVGPVSVEDLGPVGLPIRACPECGSAAIRPLQMGEGGIPGGGELLDRQRCPRCGHEGLAVVFDTREDYASFLRRLDLAWRARRP